jgi:LPXTG-site transpeptidase (sortase) family protein
LRGRQIAAALIALGAALLILPPAAVRVADWLERTKQQEITEQWLRKHPPVAIPEDEPPGADVVPAITPGEEGYLLEIPKLGLQAVVYELEAEVFSGRNTPKLKRYGLGQVPHTTSLGNVNPGGEGTAAITGHRTTSGAPFRNIHRLGRGDLIILRQGAVQQRWLVVYSATVLPGEVEAIRSREGVRRLAILACNPPFSARERLIVYATLAQEGGN